MTSCVVFDGSDSSFACDDIHSIVPPKASKYYYSDRFTIKSGSLVNSSNPHLSSHKSSQFEIAPTLNTHHVNRLTNGIEHRKNNVGTQDSLKVGSWHRISEKRNSLRKLRENGIELGSRRRGTDSKSESIIGETLAANSESSKREKIEQIAHRRGSNINYDDSYIYEKQRLHMKDSKTEELHDIARRRSIENNYDPSHTREKHIGKKDWRRETKTPGSRRSSELNTRYGDSTSDKHGVNEGNFREGNYDIRTGGKDYIVANEIRCNSMLGESCAVQNKYSQHYVQRSALTESPRKIDYQAEIVRLQRKMARLQGKVSHLQQRVTYLQSKY